MNNTKAVDVNTQAVSPVSILGSCPQAQLGKDIHTRNKSTAMARKAPRKREPVIELSRG